jgi:sorting nexin-29
VLVIPIWNKEELPKKWKEPIIVPIYKKWDKINCSNYTGISLLLTTYKILSYILLSKLTPHEYKIIGDHQGQFQSNISSTDQIFCICQILEKKWEYTGTIHQSFIDFEKAYDLVRKEVLYNILNEFGISIKLG